MGPHSHPSMYYTLKLFFSTAIFFCQMQLVAQQRVIDSLENELTKPQNDTTKINLHYYLADLLFGYDTLRPIAHLEQGLALAREIKDNYQIAVYYYWRGSFLARTSKFAYSLPFMDTAVLFFDKHAEENNGDSGIYEMVRLTKANLMNEYATAYTGLYQYEKAVNSYLQSVRQWEGASPAYPLRNQAIGINYGNIANVYRQIGQFESALKYCLMAVPYRVRDGNKEFLARVYMDISINYSSLNKIDSATFYLDKAKPLVTMINQPLLNVNFYLREGENFKVRGDFKKALLSFRTARENAIHLNHRFHMAGSINGIAESYLGLNEIDQARTEALKALSIGEQIPSARMKLKSLTVLAAVEEKSGNINKAFYYQKERLVLKDTLEKEDVKKKVRELDAQYQSGLKDSRIAQMNKDKEIDRLEGEKKSILIYVLTGGLAAVVLIGFISYRGFRSKQNLAKQTETLQMQRIKELELEKQLIAYDALLKGQEEERSRMAKDLHDGLGGMLSSVKLTLGAMKGNTILTEDNTRLFSKALDQLDHSINEMRRVAHNMMPEALVKFGLQQAIEDYCNGLREGSTLKFNTQFYGLEKRLDGPTEIIVYRIIQELLNNVMKHAKATEVLVQVMRHVNNLNITIEDNGTGFPSDAVDSKNGAGLVNVQARVDYLKGTLDVQSIAGKGTSIHIDCTISDL